MERFLHKFALTFITPLKKLKLTGILNGGCCGLGLLLLYTHFKYKVVFIHYLFIISFTWKLIVE